jgi:imidazolonepropionase
MTAAGFANARPSDRLLLRGAKQIITLQGPARIRRGEELRDVALIRDGSILIDGPVIAEVGSARRVENLKAAASAQELDARNLIVLPGLLDATRDLLPVENAGPHPDAVQNPPPEYKQGTIRTAVRSLQRQLDRLSRWGTTLAQFRMRFPEDPSLQSRLLRNLLLLELPRGGFRVDLHFHNLPRWDGDLAATFSSQLSSAAVGYWKSLESSLAVSLRSSALGDLPTPQALQAIRQLCGGLPAFLTAPEQLPWERLLALCAGSGAAVLGLPPEAETPQGRFAWFEVPWVVTAGDYTTGHSPSPAGLRHAIDRGMSLALASGYDVNHPGSMSTLLLSSLLRQEGGLDPGEILQLCIANLAHALGEGNRMGSIRAGNEANLVLLECDDYREIGSQLGAAPILATYRRGLRLSSGIPMRD